MYNPTPQDILISLDAISSSRLSSYKSFFSPASDDELYGLYCWNEVLASNFMRLTGIIEVALRNRFHLVFSQYVMANHPAGVVGTADSNNWYEVIPLASKSQSKIMELTHDSTYNKITKSKSFTPKRNQPTPNQVISSMTLGFWAPLINLSLPWNTLIPALFPNHRYASAPSYWTKPLNLTEIYHRLEMIRDIRNRVAHFEPLWKLKDILEETKPAKGPRKVEFKAPTNVTELMQRLNMLYQRAIQLLHWLSKERAHDINQTEFNNKTLYLMTEEALESFRKGARMEDVRLGSLTKSWGLKMVMKDRKPMRVFHEKKMIGNFYPTP